MRGRRICLPDRAVARYAVGVLVLSSGVVACRDSADLADQRSNTIVVAYPAATSDPWRFESAKHLIFLSMANWDENWELEGRLARAWEHSPDHREWTYHLRTDVRWQDGVPVTAHDVEFTLRLLTHPDVLAWPLDFIERITALDDSTLTIRFTGDRSFFDVSEVFYPRHLLAHLDPAAIHEWEFWRRPVGNGPYRFVREVKGTSAEFEASPDYFGAKPAVERVVLKFLSDEAGVTDLLAGASDVASYTNPAYAPTLARNPDLRPYHWIYVGVARAIYWQHRLPPFDEPEVRRALTLALDRRELLRALSLPENLPLFDVMYTPRQFRRRQLPDPLPHDPDAAKKLLEESGWRDTDGNGIVDRRGEEFRFLTLVPDYPGWEEMAVVAQSHLRRVGVDMQIQLLEAPTVISRMQAGDFEAAFAPVRHEAESIRALFGEGSWTGYSDAEVLTLLDRAMVTANPDSIDAIYERLMEIFRRDLPVTFLHPVVRTFMAHRRIRGLSEPFRADPVRFMDELWIEEGP
jgi:peptide/nickel transport system substrate-binding protein